jgi:hypothetical protein
MGRPLRKDVNGVDVIGTPAGAAAGITVEFHDGSTVQTDGIILKQRGAKTFVVARVGAPTVRFTRVLVNGTPSAGQMRMRGYNTAGVGQGAQVTANLVAIAKITKRVATDFTGVRYRWFLENDSSADYIALTPL